MKPRQASETHNSKYRLGLWAVFTAIVLVLSVLAYFHDDYRRSRGQQAPTTDAPAPGSVIEK